MKEEIQMDNKTKKSLPTAIILAHQSLQGDLKTIFGDNETSTLVVAGYTILDHLLMELRDLGFEQCIILAKQSAKNLQVRFGNTQRWGMTITVMDFVLTKDEVLREYKSLSEPNGMMVFEMDRLRSHCVKTFLEKSEESDFSLLEGVVDSQRVGVTLLKQTKADFIINSQPIELDEVTINRVNGCRDFHRVNFDVVAGNYDGLEPSVQYNTQHGLRQHWASHVHKKSMLSLNDNMIERRCMVGSRARLDSVILNHDVFVESNAELTNSVVMPNSIISNDLLIKDSIVNDGKVFQVH